MVCKEITKPFLDFAPALVVEVLSTSTAMKYRNNKFYIYQSYKIPYYLIIDADKNLVEVYHLKESGRYELEITAPLPTYQFHLDADGSVDFMLHNIWQ